LENVCCKGTRVQVSIEDKISVESDSTAIVRNENTKDEKWEEDRKRKRRRRKGRGGALLPRMEEKRQRTYEHVTRTGDGKDTFIARSLSLARQERER